MMSEKARICSRKCVNGDLAKSPGKRSSLHTQNKYRLQRSPGKSKNIVFEVPSRAGNRRKHISTQTTVAEEPDSTSLSFVQRRSKQLNNDEANVNENCHLTWGDVLRLQNEHISKSERNKLENDDQFERLNKEDIPRSMCMLNKLVNTLHEKVSRTENEEVLYLISNIRQILTNVSKVESEVNKQVSVAIKYGNGVKVNGANLGKSSDCQCYVDADHHIEFPENKLQSSNLSKPVENKNAEDLDEIKTGIASLNLKTDEYKKNFHDFQKFMIYLYNENKNADKIKSDRKELEMKLTASVYENKRLITELKLLKEENLKVANELKNKNDEISAWKDQILKIRHMISPKSKRKPNFIGKSGLGISSISGHHHTECPVSSSPLDMSLLIESLPVEENKTSVAGAVRSEENDSGIQSNTPNDNKKCNRHDDDSGNRSSKSSFHLMLSDLKQHLQLKDADLQLQIPSFEDPSICLSEATYKCSMPSLNTSER